MREYVSVCKCTHDVVEVVVRDVVDINNLKLYSFVEISVKIHEQQRQQQQQCVVASTGRRRRRRLVQQKTSSSLSSAHFLII